MTFCTRNDASAESGKNRIANSGPSRENRARTPALAAARVFFLATLATLGTPHSSEGANPSGKPTISGTPTQGQTLTAGQGNVADGDGINTSTITYTWLRCNANGDIDTCTTTMGTGTTYTLTAAEVGLRIRLRINFTDNASNAESVTSFPWPARSHNAIAGLTNHAATGKPTISGTATQGETLTAGQGNIADTNGINTSTITYTWLRCDSNANNCNTEMATAATYTLTAAEVGLRIRLRIDFTDNDGFSESVTSFPWPARSDPVIAPAPNTAATGTPTISGTANVGQALTAAQGTVADGDGINTSTIAYKWLRCDIDGNNCNTQMGTGTTYALTSSEHRRRILVRMEFTDNRSNAESRDSAPWPASTSTPIATAGNAAATGAPAITGTGRLGNTLTVAQGTVADTDGIDAASITYTWLRCAPDGTACNELGTGTTYTVAYTDVGARIRVRMKFDDDDDNVEIRDSALLPGTGVISGGNATGTPTITGTARVGATLTAAQGDVADTDGINASTITYRWMRCSSSGNSCPTEMGTGATYTLTSAEEGLRIRVRMEFDDNNGDLETRRSAAWPASGLITAGNATGRPTISGTATEGETLTAAKGSVADPDGINDSTIDYKWMRCDSNADNCDTEMGTGATYTLTSAEVGLRIRVRIVFDDDDGDPETRESFGWPSRNNDPIARAPNSDATGAPTITGTAKVGQTLTAAQGDVADTDGIDTNTITYKWWRSNNEGKRWTRLGTGATYTLTAAEVKHRIIVSMTFVDNKGYGETRHGAPWPALSVSAVTTAANAAATGAPTITGTAVQGTRVTAAQGTVADTDVIDTSKITYTWVRCDASGNNCNTTPIIRSSFDFYVLHDDDVGVRIRVRMVFEDNAGNLETRESAAWPANSVIAVGATGRPTITGTATIGQSLTAGQGDVADAAGINESTISYTWLRCHPSGNLCTEQIGTGSTYTLAHESAITITLEGDTPPPSTGSDVGRRVRVRMEFEDNNGVAKSRESLAFPAQGQIADNGRPWIYGFPREPAVLNAIRGTIPRGHLLYYQWLRCNSNGQDCTTEIGTTGSRSYTVTQSDVGHKLRVKATFTSSSVIQERYSPAYPSGTSTIQAPAVCNAPTLSDRVVVWTGKINMGRPTGWVGHPSNIDYGNYGWSPREYRGSLNAASRDFHVEAGELTPYTLGFIRVSNYPAPHNFSDYHQTLYVSTSPALADGDASLLQLHVCDSSTFNFSDAADQDTFVKKWADTGLDWTTFPTRDIRLSVPEASVSTLRGLTVSPGTLSPAFDSSTTSYEVSAGDVSQITVTPTKTVPDATVTYVHAGGNNIGATDTNAVINLSTGKNDITVKVISENTESKTHYKLSVGRGSSDTTLSALAVSPGTLFPAFASATTDYSAVLANSASRITVTPTKSNSHATVSYLDGEDEALTDADEITDGFQVDLAVGLNVVKVKVAAQDNVAVGTYTLRLQRSNATETCSAPTLSPEHSLLWKGTIVVGKAVYGHETWYGHVSGPNGGIVTGDFLGQPSQTFTFEGREIKVRGVSLLLTDDTSLPRHQSLSLTFHKPHFNREEYPRLQFHVCDQKFQVSSSGTYWQGTGLDWSSVTFRTLRLSVRPASTDATLSALAVSSGTLDPEFDAATTEYTATVAGTVTQATVTPTTTDENATVSYLDGSDEALTDADTSSADTFEVDLATGENVVKVVVTAEDAETTKTYTLTVGKGSDDATLSALATSSGTLDPTFAAATTEYTATVASTVERITVTPTTTDTNATVSYLDGSDDELTDADTSSANTFEVDLDTGENVIKVVVLAEDTVATESYTLTVTRQSADATLSALTLSRGTLDPAFDAATEGYAATVPSTVARVTVTPTTNHEGASVAYLDASNAALADADTSSANTFEVDLDTGANVVKVQVTPEDTAAATKTYTLTINRQSTDATLSALATSSGTLTPAFAAETLAYTVEVGNAVARVTVTPTTSHAEASVAYLDASNAALADADTSSAATFEVDLEVADNVVRVQVTPEDTAAATKTYTLTITRVSTDAKLAALALSQGTLTPEFAADTLAYTAEVANAVDEVTVTPETNHAAATVAYFDDGDSALADADAEAEGFQAALDIGENVVKVRVTAQDGTTTETYALTITRHSTDASLSALSLSAGELSPAFAAETAEYAVRVENAVARVTVSATTNNANASFVLVGDDDAELTDADTSSANTFEVDLEVADNIVKVLVTAQDGIAQQTYKLTITRVSTDASLSQLRVLLHPPEPAVESQRRALNRGPVPVRADAGADDEEDNLLEFDPEVTEYTETFGNHITQVTVMGETNHPAAQVAYLDGSGEALIDADEEKVGLQIHLDVGSNVFKVRVTAQDGETVREYSVQIGRLAEVSTDATLSALALDEGKLTPAFALETTEYAATVEVEVTRVTVRAQATHAEASVAYFDRNDQPFADADADADGFQVDLTELETVIRVRVTAQSDATTDYVVTVTRREPVVAGLTELRLSEGELSPPFDPTVTEYTARVDNDVSRVSVWSTTEDERLRVEILDANDEVLVDADPDTPDTFDVDLEVGENVFKVRVTQLRVEAERRRAARALNEEDTTAEYTEYVVTLTREEPVEPGGRPGAPGHLTATLEGSSAVVLAWSAPGDDGGSPVTGYRIEVSDDGVEWSELVADTGDVDTTYRHEEGLSAATTRSYRVSARNANGAGAASNVASATMRVARPGAPGSLRGVGGEQSVTLTWSAPESDGGSAIMRYEYEVDASASWTSVGEALRAEVGNLVNGQAYAFRVRAVNAVGAGEAARVTVVAGRLDNVARGWLARFNREAAVHVTGAIEERLRGGGGASGVVLGGASVPLDGAVEPGGDAVHGEWRLAGGESLVAPGRALEVDAGEEWMASGDALGISEVLLASSFHLTSEEQGDAAPRWSVWGRGVRSNFSGSEDALSFEGEVTTATLGVDVESDASILGVALSHSEGDGEFRMRGGCAQCEDVAESTLTGLYPYLRYRLNERVSLWGVVGLGQGELRLRPDGGAVSVETGVETTLAALGGRGVLYPGATAGGFEVAVRSDVLLATARTDEEARLLEIETDTLRARLLLEGSRSFEVGAQGVLTPAAEIGYRYDTGDAEEGSGLEVGGSMRYAANRLAGELAARTLVMHEEGDYEEWGVSGTVHLDPDARGRGLSMRIGSVWGAAASGGAERLWTQAPGALSLGSFESEATLDAEVGYGLAAPRGRVTPYTGVALSGSAETWRAGVRWEPEPAFELSVEARLAASAGDGTTNDGLWLRASRRW